MSEGTNTNPGLFGLNFGFPPAGEAKTEEKVENNSTSTNIFGIEFGNTTATPTSDSTTQSNGLNIFGIDFGEKRASNSTPIENKHESSIFGSGYEDAGQGDKSKSNSVNIFGIEFGEKKPTAGESNCDDKTGNNGIFGSGFGIDTTANTSSNNAAPSGGLNIFGIDFGEKKASDAESNCVDESVGGGDSIFGSGFGVDTTAGANSNAPPTGLNIFNINFGDHVVPTSAEPVTDSNTGSAASSRRSSMFLGMDLSVIGIDLGNGESTDTPRTPPPPPTPIEETANPTLFGIDLTDPFKLKQAETTSAAQQPVEKPAKRQSVFLGIDFAAVGIDFGEAATPNETETVSTKSTPTSNTTTPVKASPKAVETPVTGSPTATKRPSVLFGIDLGAIGIDLPDNSGPTRAESPKLAKEEEEEPLVPPPPVNVPMSPAPNSGLAFLNFGTPSTDFFDAMKSPIGRHN